MNKKKKISERSTERHFANPDIFILYELEFKKDIIKPGDKFKIKHDRATYKFQCLAHNTKLDKMWVEAMCVETGEFRSFWIDKITTVIRPKKKRATV